MSAMKMKVSGDLVLQRVWVVMVTVKAIAGLRCPPCSKLHCDPRPLPAASCRGSVTTSICGCCPVCARVDGESCGGEYGYLGKCDLGLYCDSTLKSTSNAIVLGVSELVGTCTKLPSAQADEGRPLPCRPLCSPTYCTRNPRAVCSASKAADIQQPCQGECQHTSCSACRYVNVIDCPQCTSDDFRCIRKYGRCMKRSFCSRRKFPCKRKRLKIVENGKFVCKVPECSLQ